MLTENLSTLKIHKLTKEQYDRELSSNNIDENALYLTPDEEIDLSHYVTIEEVSTTYETKTDAISKSKLISAHIADKNNPHGTTLSSFGITATSKELNHLDGVTSNIQTQLNNKADSDHTHTFYVVSDSAPSDTTLLWLKPIS